MMMMMALISKKAMRMNEAEYKHLRDIHDIGMLY